MVPSASPAMYFCEITSAPKSGPSGKTEARNEAKRPLSPRAYRREPAYPLWAHAARCPLPGAGEWLRPLDPCKGKKAHAVKPQKNTRTAWIKLRVTPDEKAIITAKAAAQGQTITDFIRQRALDYRLRQTPLEKERVRQLARIGANLNQLARWANIHKSRAEAISVLAALAGLEREFRDTPPPDEDAPCT